MDKIIANDETDRTGETGGTYAPDDKAQSARRSQFRVDQLEPDDSPIPVAPDPDS